MPLTDTAIRNARPKEKPYNLLDEKGLYVLVNRHGKYFRMDYRYGRKRKTLAQGVYPEIRLAEARDERDKARKLLRNSVDPSQHKMLERTLESGEDVLISGFGKFCVREKGRRKGRNPRTAEDAILRERRIVTFKR